MGGGGCALHAAHSPLPLFASGPALGRQEHVKEALDFFEIYWLLPAALNYQSICAGKYSAMRSR